jgi:DCN1-like protein 4/5
LKAIEALFNKYKEKLPEVENEALPGGEEPEEEVIGPQGIETLCKDLQIDPEDVVTLVLAWRLGATEMGYFTRSEFVDGLKKMQVDSLEKLKAEIPKMRQQLNDATCFREIYRFAFQFAKAEEESKCIDIVTAEALLQLLLVGRYQLATSFAEFLKQSPASLKGLNNDQWMSLLEFVRQTDSFDGYDENGAWPCVIDEWVLWAIGDQDKSENDDSAYSVDEF